MSPEPVVVTGMGVVSALGCALDGFFAALCAGRCGGRDVPLLASEGLRHHEAAVVERREILERLSAAERDIPWASAMGLVAARAALTDAGVSSLPPDVAMYAGCSIGAPAAIDRPGVPWRDLDPTEPATLSRYSQGTVIACIAERLGVRGGVSCLTTTCAAGNYAIGAAVDALRAGTTPLAIAGGVEEVSVLPYTAFHQIRALATVCRPFDVHRNGILFGEGAAFLVLETARAAAQRRARVYAEVLAVGYANDAHNLVAPDPQGAGAALAIRRALLEAGVAPREVGYVNAHGTGTLLNDPAEVTALTSVFGDAVKDLSVSSTKGATGHTMAAASAIEAVVAILALNRSELPPTAGLAELDPTFRFDAIQGTTRRRSISVALSNGFGFGGNDAVLAMAKPGRSRPATKRRRVYVHGGAALAGVALGREAVLARLSVGEAATEEDARAGFDPASILGKKGLRHVDRSALLLAATLDHDLNDWPNVAPEAAGAVFGSAFPAYGTIMAILRECQAGGADKVNPMLVPYATANCASSWWLIRRGIRGFSGSVGSGECAGLDAILMAATQIEHGRVDAMVAGGVEAHTDELWTGLHRMQRGVDPPLAEGVGAVTLGADPAGAWARVVAFASAFDRTSPARARDSAMSTALERAHRNEADLLVATHAVGGSAPARQSAQIDATLGETLGAAGAIAVLHASHWLAADRSSAAAALVVADSVEGYASALVLEAVSGRPEKG